MKEPKKYLNDKILLILSAIVLLFCTLMYLFLLKKLKINEDWIDYISLSVLYIVVFIYGILKQSRLKKKVTNLAFYLLLIFFAVFPVLVGFIIFHFKLLPFPKSNLIYLISGLILLPIAAVCFEKNLKFLERRKHSNERGRKMGKTISKKNAGEVESKRLMFAPIVFATNEESAAAGIVPDPALNEEDGIGCEAVFENDEDDNE